MPTPTGCSSNRPGRRTERTVRTDPAVGSRMRDPADPYRSISARRVVAALTGNGAVEHIDELAWRSMDAEEYPNHGEVSGPRVVLEIGPEHVVASAACRRRLWRFRRFQHPFMARAGRCG